MTTNKNNSANKSAARRSERDGGRRSPIIVLTVVSKPPDGALFCFLLAFCTRALSRLWRIGDVGRLDGVDARQHDVRRLGLLLRELQHAHVLHRGNSRG